MFASVLLLILLAAGCTRNASSSSRDAEPPAPSLARQAPITNTDPCATRLHDISGALLAYYFHHFELPATLDELEPVSGSQPLPPMICPVTQAPYLYDAGGIHLPERGSWIVLYDPAPAHSRHRWAVTVQQPPDASANLVTKVIALPESFFALRPPR